MPLVPEVTPLPGPAAPLLSAAEAASLPLAGREAAGTASSASPGSDRTASGAE